MTGKEKIFKKVKEKQWKKFIRIMAVQISDAVLVALFFFGATHVLPWVFFYGYAAIYAGIHLYIEIKKLAKTIRENKEKRR